MEHSIFSQPVSWIIAALLGFYLFILFRTLVVFFLMGGRRELLEREKAVTKLQPEAPPPSPTPEPTPLPPRKAARKLLA